MVRGIQSHLVVRILLLSETVLLDQVAVRKFTIAHKQLFVLLYVSSSLQDHERFIVKFVMKG